ncbi:MAG: reverse transcriptase domain-containing protein [Actinomycetota bacterium]|nr:reverse transcriptase domain-containing protein [Actinomycetota bacterium]
MATRFSWTGGLDRSLLQQLDLTAAVDAEASYAPPYLPPSPWRPALSDRSEEVARLFAGQFRTAHSIEVAEILQVAKRGGGLRPVAAVEFGACVLYRALCDVVRPNLPTLDRSFSRKQELERAPLEAAGCEYVVIGDVASFYDLVDHGLLVEEIVAQSGEAEVAETLGAFLQALMGRSFSLPQVLEPSDLLSEAYIDVAERSLLRGGFDVWRFNDDFWIAARSWREANDAVEALHHDLRRIGLILNEGKTRPLSVDLYRQWLEEPEARWTQINEEAQVDLRGVSIYDGEEGVVAAEVLPHDVYIGAAEHALELALSGEQEVDRLQEEVNRQLIVAALAVLEFVESPAGIDYVKRIVAHAPHITHRVGRYLMSVAPAAQGDVVALVDDLREDAGTYVSEWQATWLFEPLRHVDELPGPTRDWVAGYVSAASDFVRGCASLLLAEKSLIGADELAETYGTVRRAARADVVWAIARGVPAEHRLVRAVQDDDAFQRWIVESARE